MRYWLRFKHAECFGALLTRQHFHNLIPLFLASLGLACMFGMIFVAAIVAPESGNSPIAGGLTVILVIFVIAQTRYLVGYLRRDSIAIPPDLAHRIAPGANWPEIAYNRRARIILALAGGNKRAALWIVAVVIWVIVLIGAQGILSGEFVPGVTHGG